MIPIMLLEDNDIIEPTDFGRQLNLTYEGQSDYLQETSYGSRINRLGWMRAKEICPAWTGGTVEAFRKAMRDLGLTYEFVRGPIPKQHIESKDA